MTGCPVDLACLVAWRLGELSQQSVTPQVWQVRRWTHPALTFTHSWHSRRAGVLTSVMLLRWLQGAGIP
jgi:hypothetical protein